MVRWWQTLILNSWKHLLAYLPVETVIRVRHKDYYRVLAVADQQADATPFIVFMLSAPLDALREAVVTDQVGDQVTDQVAVLIRAIGIGELGSNDLMQALTYHTASRFAKTTSTWHRKTSGSNVPKPLPRVARPSATG